VEGPAAAGVGTGAAQVVEHRRADVAGGFQALGQGRQAAKVPFLVNLAGQGEGDLLVGAVPAGADGDGAERVAEQVANEVGLGVAFLLGGGAVGRGGGVPCDGLDGGGGGGAGGLPGVFPGGARGGPGGTTPGRVRRLR